MPFRSLVAAIIRLMVQLEISNGGYAAHTDVDCKLCLPDSWSHIVILIFLSVTLTILLYYSALESGLALIAACLPTLHYLVARPPFRKPLSSIGSLLGLDSLRSRFTINSQTNQNTAPDTEILVTKKVSQSSQTDGSFARFEHDVDAYKLSDVEDGLELSLVPVRPGHSHTRVCTKVL